MKRSIVLFTMFLLLALFTSQCAPAATPTPETIIKTVEVEKEVVVTQEVEKIVTEIVEVEVPAEPTDKTVIDFWTTDNEEDRVIVYEEIATRFMSENPDIEVRIVPI